MLSKVNPLVCKLRKDPGSSHFEFVLATNEILLEEKEGMKVNRVFTMGEKKMSVQIKFVPDNVEMRERYLDEVLGKMKELTIFFSNVDYSSWKSTKFNNPSIFESLAQTLTMTLKVRDLAISFLDDRVAVNQQRHL